jgi:hypothetical protein
VLVDEGALRELEEENAIEAAHVLVIDVFDARLVLQEKLVLY